MTADRELRGVDVDLAVEDDVPRLDRADACDEFGVEREIGCGGDSRDLARLIPSAPRAPLG